MSKNIIDYYITGFPLNGFILANLYYYLDITSLIKLIHTNKLQYKKHKLVYSIIYSYVYKSLMVSRNIRLSLRDVYSCINKRDYLFIIHKKSKYNLFEDLYYIIDYNEYYNFIDKLCKINYHLNNKIKLLKKRSILYNL